MKSAFAGLYAYYCIRITMKITDRIFHYKIDDDLMCAEYNEVTFCNNHKYRLHRILFFFNRNIEIIPN